MMGEPGVPGSLTVEGAADHVRRGGLLIHPTETVYGFGGLARGPALDALRVLKGRQDGAFILLIPSLDGAAGLDWTPEARALADALWPGGLTLVLQDPHHRFPEGVRGPGDTVAVRVTSNALTARLVELLGEPMTSTSANRPGEAPARDAAAARRTARALGASMAVLDGGPLAPSPPSTLVACRPGSCRMLREGAVSTEALRRVVPDPGIWGQSTRAAGSATGMQT